MAEDNMAELDFPINQQLLEDATRARESWRVIRDRIAKIEENRSQVSDAVYKRVKSDYSERLDQATDEVMRKKADIDREIAILAETRKKVEGQLAEHSAKLEEIKFRNTLGEFTEEEYQSLARTEQEKIGKFETVQNAVAGNMRRYQSVFEDEPELGGTTLPPSEPEEEEEEEVSEAGEVTGLTPPHGGPPDLSEETGPDIRPEEGPDYFGAEAEQETDADKTNPELEESATAKATSSPASRPRVETPKARVVIISGDEAGAAYPLKGVVSIGRAESNTISLRDAKVSRQHAQIQQQGEEFVVLDLNSSNGTYVNGQKVEEYVLANGDEITIGDYVMQFQD